MLGSRKDEEFESRPLAERIDDYEEDADSRHSVDDRQAAAAPPRRQTRRRRTNGLVYCCIGVLFVASNLVSILMGGLISKQVRDEDSICAAHTSHYCESSAPPARRR